LGQISEAVALNSGLMRDRLHGFDWHASPLGRREAWPQSLGCYVDLMLTANRPMFMAWGAERIWLYNDAFVPILGEKHPDALGQPSAQVWAEAWGELRPIFDKAYAGEPVHAERFALPLNRGGKAQEAVFDFTYTPVRGDDGSFCGVFGICTDTTAKVQGEKEEAAAIARQRRQFEQAPGFICITQGPQHIFKFVNQAHQRLFNSADWIGKPIREAFAQAAGQGFFDLMDQVFETGERVTAQAAALRFRLTPDAPEEEHLLDFVHAPITDQDGRVTGIFCEGFDTTEIAKANREIERSRQRLQDLNQHLEREIFERSGVGGQFWEISPDLLGVLQADGYFVRANPAWAATLGWTEAEVKAVSVFELLHPEDIDASREIFEYLKAGNPIQRFENRYRCKAGDYRWIAWTAMPLGGSYYCSGRDITAQKTAQLALAAAQDALRQSQKMEAVGQLTGGLAHDFNNLLAGISGSLELLQRRLDEGRIGGAERYIAAAQSSTRRAAALTQRLLAFSRRQTLDPRPTDVNRLIHGMEELIRRSVGPEVALEVMGADGLWTTLIDPSQLENALLNLCINGRDAMAPAGGRLTIETVNKGLDEQAGLALELPAGQYIAVCVTDTGTGMPPEVIERAFEPFYTTKPLGQGTGLGLSMIYGFVRQSGGQVRIFSEQGQGTTMVLYLPRHAGLNPGKDEEPAPEAVIGGETDGETVLVVDDEDMLITEILGELGYRCLEAKDGPGALAALQREPRVDLLITDVGLPGGLNGRQIADAARQSRPELKILFITGYAENAVIGSGHLDPGMEVITKPFAMNALAAKIRDMMEQS
jgi:PAS domain S-box-containing protein